ncbi:MAG: zinc-finger domain-containing protein [Kiloniellales bacterium]
MQPVETVLVETRTVACDGGGALGHPRVFLNMGDADAIDCPYCGRRFVLKPDSEAEEH